MKEFRRAVWVCLLIAVSATAVLVFAQTGFSQSPGNSLDRIMDRVVVSGDRLKNVQGKDISRLRLMAFQNGKPASIPFQVDEKNPEGDYVMARPGGGHDRDTDNGALDNNDELVFMAKDSGEQGDPAASGLDPKAWDEIELKDAKTGARGFAYLVYFEKDPPPLSDVSYMKYIEKAERDEVITPYYTLHFPKNNVFISDIMIHESAGGNNRDFMDRIKMRTGVDVLSGAISVERTEEDFVTEVTGIIAGPVRVIRQTDTRITLLLSLKSPSAIVNGTFFPCSFEFPSVLSLPFRMDLIASDAHIRQGWDLNREALGWKFMSNLNPEPVTYDGKMSQAEKELAEKNETLRWALCTGKPGTFLFFGEWDTNAPIKALLYYEDDLSRMEPPENDPGVMGFAYRLVDVVKMGGEEYPFNIINYIVPDFDGNVERALRVLDNPLEVEINP